MINSASIDFQITTHATNIKVLQLRYNLNAISIKCILESWSTFNYMQSSCVWSNVNRAATGIIESSNCRHDWSIEDATVTRSTWNNVTRSLILCEEKTTVENFHVIIVGLVRIQLLRSSAESVKKLRFVMMFIKSNLFHFFWAARGNWNIFLSEIHLDGQLDVTIAEQASKNCFVPMTWRSWGNH